MPRKINAELTGTMTRPATNRQAVLWNEEVSRFQPTSIFAAEEETIPAPTPTAGEAPTLLALRQTGGAPSLFRLTGGQVFTQCTDANTFSAAQTLDYSAQAGAGGLPVNDVVEFNGRHYALHTVSTTGYEVQERQDDNTWVQVQSLTLTAAAGHRSGLFVSNDGAGPILCYLAIATTTNPATYLCKTSDGTTWDNLSIGTISSTSTLNCFQPGSAIHSKGTIYIVIRNRQGANGAGMAIVVNVRSGIRSVIANFTSNPFVCGCFAKIYGRIFVHFGHVIYEYIGGSLISRATLPNGGSSAYINVLNSQSLLFADGDQKLVIFYPTSTDGTIANSFWRGGELAFANSTDTAPVFTQKDSIIPEALASGGSQANKANAGFVAHIDNETDPANPQVYIWWVTSHNSTVAYAKYINTDTELLGADLGVTRQAYTISARREGGGEQISNDDLADVRFISVATTVGTGGVGQWYVSWKFKALDTLQTYSAKIFISTTEGTQFAQATLVGTGDNCTRDGDLVTGCANNTLCGVNVDLLSMGILTNSPVQVAVKLYVE